ncbi:MAG: S8 family serine peptidase, partial [Cyclobacteriaceae bacterium]|nr:S8 family serine peptidase [Cyclobacteriaceae bacterium]
MRILVIAIFIFLSNADSFAQIDRYVVYFTDKFNSTYTVTQPEQFLSLRSIARRSKLGIPVIEDDLPVNQNYINGVELTGAQAFYSSKWLNAILIQATATQKDQILLLPFVSRIEFAAPLNPLIMGGRTTLNTNKFQITTDSTFAQNDLIGTSFMNADGINGMGILIGNFDAGFPGVNTISSFSKIFPQNILDSYNYVSNNTNVYTAHPHGTNTLSLLGAEINGEFYGIATGAKYILYVTEDIASEYRIEEYNWLFAAERADSIGVDIITSSLGYYTFDDKSMDYSTTDLNGETAIITKAANKAIEKGIVVVTSAGNEGNNSWGKITFPGDCFGCIVVGNVNYEGIRNLSSSFGPTEDGRIKPDVMAMGTSISVINPDNT